MARNIADALTKLQCDPVLVSAVGDDEEGRILTCNIPHENITHVSKVSEYPSAQCIVAFNKLGECQFLIGDMKIHGQISSEMVNWK